MPKHILHLIGLFFASWFIFAMLPIPFFAADNQLHRNRLITILFLTLIPAFAIVLMSY